MRIVNLVIYSWFLSLLVVPGAFAGAELHEAEDHKHVESVYKSGPLITLEEAINRAIQASPRLKSFQSKVDAARGSEEQAGYWQNPEIEFEAENVAGSGQYSGTDSGEFTYGLSQTLEIGGKRDARVNAARSSREAADARLLAERANLVLRVKEAYSKTMTEAEHVELAVEQERLAKDVMDTVIERINAAAEPEIQFAKAEVAYTTSIINREQVENKLRIAKEKLLALWNEDDLIGQLDHKHFYYLERPSPIQLYQKRMENLPDIHRYSYLIAEKDSLIDFEKAQNIPDPSFSLGVRDIREQDEQALLFGISIPIPVFNQNSGNISRAMAEKREVESDKLEAELLLKQELVENWQEWKSSYSEADRLKTKLIPAAEKAFKLAREGYELGRFPYLEVLDAQRTLFDAKEQYYESLKRHHIARARVERLTTQIGEQ